MTHRTSRTHRKPARTAARPRQTRSTIFAASVFVGVAILGVAVSPIDRLYSDPKAAVVGIDSNPPPAVVLRGDPERTAIAIHDGQPATEVPDQRDGRDLPLGAPGQLDGRDRGGRRTLATRLGEADGVVPDGVTISVFDDGVPAVANLDPDLLGALRRAAADAGDEVVELSVNSGWRSPAYQEQLLAEATVQYGSEEEAARWVATAETSAHVSGDAIDIGPGAASAWLSAHGSAYGLCQIYGNEPWHFELRPDAIEVGCPPVYDDPTQDPRMQG